MLPPLAGTTLIKIRRGVQEAKGTLTDISTFTENHTQLANGLLPLTFDTRPPCITYTTNTTYTVLCALKFRGIKLLWFSRFGRPSVNNLICEYFKQVLQINNAHPTLPTMSLVHCHLYVG